MALTPMRQTTHSRKTASDVGQADKYDELDEQLVYSSPHLEHTPTQPGVDGRPGTPVDEPVTTSGGQELVAGRRREWDARQDATYTVGAYEADGHRAPDGVMEGQAAGDRLAVDPGAILAEATGVAGEYWHDALLDAYDESLPDVPPPFPVTSSSDDGERESPAVTGSDTRARERYTLAQEERIEGEFVETQRHREKAWAAAGVGIDRAARCRAEIETTVRSRRTDWIERAVLAVGGDPGAPDPRERLSRDELAAVNRAAARVADDLTPSPSTAAVSRRLAGRVVHGSALAEAVFATRDEYHGQPGTAQPIGTVEPGQPWADIQGRVTRLFEPAAVSQQQVGYVEGDTGTVKVTVWEKSQQDIVLHEGDVVRITGGKPGVYDGMVTLAVVARSTMVVVEEGDGPGPIHGVRYQADWEAGRGVVGEQRLRACSPPRPGEGESVSRPVHRPADRVGVPIEQPDAAAKRDLSEHHLAAGVWLRADETYPAVAYIPVWSADDRRRRQAAHASDNPAVHLWTPDCSPAGFTRVPLRFPDWWTEQDRVEVVEDGSSTGVFRLRRRGPVCDATVGSDDGAGTEQLDTLAQPAPTSTMGPAASAPGLEAGDSKVVANGGMNAATNGGTEFLGPTTSARCPTCDHDRAAYELQQLRAADEAPTRLFTCVECGHRWREND